MMHESDRIRVSFVDGEHLLSGWVRHNIRLGFVHLPFDRCLQYWGLPKQHLKAQRVDGFVIETVLAQVAPDPQKKIKWLNDYTSRRLWLLGADESELREEESKGLLPNQEKNMFAFHLSWQLCPRCLVEDKDRYGFSYWHREHQLPSIAHCLKHNLALLSHEELVHMKRLVLPEKYHQQLSLISVAASKDLLAWSRFVGIVDGLIKQDPSLPAIWRNCVRDILDLPNPVKLKHRPMFKELLQQLGHDVGSSLMSYLFRAWRDQRKERPNLLWMILSGIDPHRNIQNPVLWLIVFYWLRHQLPVLQDL